MSSKHLRRLLEEKEKEASPANVTSSEEEEEEKPVGTRVNRFAFMADSDSAAEEEPEKDVSEEEEKQTKEKEKTKNPPANKKKRNKKTKKGGKREEKEQVEDEDALLEKLVEENLKFETNDSSDVEAVEIEQIFKVDPRLFDPAAELKRALGKAFKDASAGSSNNSAAASHRQWKGAGRLVKQKMNWPPVRNIGLSMVPVESKLDGPIKWFKFEHNGHYEKLERMCWLSEDTYDVHVAEEILYENYYHLNSLLMLANMLRMQEDITQAGDCIERGIFYCEQSFHSLFQPMSWNHRIDYTDYENRAFFLLLHRYMLNCVHKRCFETALNIAKLIFSKDPQKDPLAILLTIDSVAIKAKQYKWFITFYNTAKNWKNLDLLPNVRYSLALCHFLTAKTDEEKAKADELLRLAICTFPGVVTQLLEELQIAADAAVEGDEHLSVFAYNKEPEGLKLVIKLFVKQSAELWKQPEVLSWLEAVTRSTIESGENRKILVEWEARRARVFVGCPQNVRRLAILLGLESSGNGVTDPEPPVNGRARYTRGDGGVRTAADQSMLAGFVHSLLSEYDVDTTLVEHLGRYYEQMRGALLNYQQAQTGDGGPGEQEQGGQEREE